MLCNLTVSTDLSSLGPEVDLWHFVVAPDLVESLVWETLQHFLNPDIAFMFSNAPGEAFPISCVPV